MIDIVDYGHPFIGAVGSICDKPNLKDECPNISLPNNSRNPRTPTPLVYRLSIAQNDVSATTQGHKALKKLNGQ